MSTMQRPRARDLGIVVGRLAPGPLNAITDVEGVAVGHRTLRSGAICTGVTAILPHRGNIFQEKVPGAVFVGNGFGKLAGSTQVQELGSIETPVILTNTLAVAAGIEGAVRHTLTWLGNETVRSVNALVGETNDGGLNDIRGLHVTPEDVRAAIDDARTGPVEEGSVGAGTGTICFGWKGGIGTASRRLHRDAGGWTVGVLVQSNYGGELIINGVPFDPPQPGSGDGSCMMVVATDAPLDARNLERLAARCMVGLGRTGSCLSNGSGDYAIAFSTAYRIPHTGELLDPPVALVANRAMSPLFQAVVEATEEALLNSLLRATSVTGRDGRVVEAIPIDRVRSRLEGR